MSKLMLRLVEQRYRAKFEKSREELQRSLNAECKGHKVDFLWNSRKEDRVDKIAGTTKRGYFNPEGDFTLVIEFENPDSKQLEMTVRSIRELVT